MSLAQQAWDAGDTGRALALLEKQQPRDGQEDLRGFEWRYLRALCRDGSRMTLRGHTGRRLGGRVLARRQDALHQRVGEPARPDVGPRFPALREAPEADGLSLALSPDGGILALSSQNGKSVRFWDVAGRCERASLSLPEDADSVAFSPDGKLVAIELL